MTMAILTALSVLTVALVFAAGWQMAPPQNAVAGGTGALLLLVLHPAFLCGFRASSPWDAFFVMFFLCAWLWMENWSLFMRSWILAGIFAFGLWVGTSFVLWGIVALVPWVVFSRRPLEALVSLLTVLLGGLAIFGATWGAASLVLPNLGRPFFSPWIRWGTLQMPSGLSLPWYLLALGAVIERFQEMMQTRRADASIFAAMLLVVTVLFGSPVLDLAMIALAAPLIMRNLARREFLFPRGVRWVAAIAFLLALGGVMVFHKDTRMATGLAIFVVVLGARRFYSPSRLPWPLAGQAACVGAYLAESVVALIPH